MSRQHLNLTLEELSLGYRHCKQQHTNILELKSMPRLKILNVCNKTVLEDEIQNLRKHLPHLIIRTFYEGVLYSLENRANLWGIQQLCGPHLPTSSTMNMRT